VRRFGIFSYLKRVAVAAIETAKVMLAQNWQLESVEIRKAWDLYVRGFRLNEKFVFLEGKPPSRI